ncbi:MAG: aldo/keto reductase [Halodesulfurarchaeum sp.]
MSVPTTTLPSGDEMPMVGFGTWDLSDGTATESVTTALEAGYSHVDTAEGYHNEAQIGEALEAVDRSELFLTSKVLPKHLDYESVIASAEATLDRLGTDYLDLYLVHWPNPAISIRETLGAMAELHERGLVRNVGVSNFSPYQLSAALHVTEVPIAVNQIEFHPYLQREDWVEYTKDQDVTVEAAAPLARGEVLEDPVVQELAEDYGKTPAQIVLRWAIENDVVVVPKSSSEDHIAANLAVTDWELDPADHERLSDLGRGQAVYDSREKDWSDDVYGIEP